MVMSLAGDQRVVGHRWNETRQLDFEAFIFKKSSMHSNKKRQVAHRVSGQHELDYLGAENVIDPLPKINRESNEDNHEITRKTKSHTLSLRPIRNEFCSLSFRGATRRGISPVRQTLRAV